MSNLQKLQMPLPERTRLLDQRLAAPMFSVSLVALALLAALLHLHLVHDGAAIIRYCFIGLALLYPLFWCEAAAHFIIGSPRARTCLWYCFFPFLRVGGRDHITGKKIWLPWTDWKVVDRNLERRLARDFSIPMIIAALLVLPVITIEFFWAEYVEANPGWQWSLQIAAAFIWAAFTFEFTILMSVVKYRFAYVRRHWIDAAIILLPMVTFIRAARLAQLARLNQISRAARIYRLRGLAMRLWRALVTLEVVEMLLSRNPERRLEKLEIQLEEKLEDIAFLKRDITRLQKRVAEQLAKEEREYKALDDSDCGDSISETPNPATAPTSTKHGQQSA